MAGQVINIFFAYTDDSSELLQIAKNEVEIINNSIQGNMQLNFKEWKKNTISTMGNPETKILEQLPMNENNYVVFSFRFRYGKPTGNINPDTGIPYQSGMEEEFFIAYRLWMKYKKPEIMVFKSVEDIPRKYAADASNQKINEFFKEFAADGEHPGLYKEYSTKEQFREIFRQNILTHIFKVLSQQQIGKNKFVNFFLDEDNLERNKSKQEELQQTSILKLHANTGYSFLVPKASHGTLMRKGLDRGMKVQIIIQNPWSVNAILTLLRKDDFQSDKDYTDYLKNKLPADKLMEIYRSCHWLEARLSVCINSYKRLKRKYKSLIELRLSNRDLSNSILLTENYLFFEPYFGILEMDNKDISVFEVQFSKQSTVYKDTDTYFNKLWETSYTFTYYEKNRLLFETRLKNQLEKVGV